MHLLRILGTVQVAQATAVYKPNSKSLERAWSRGIVDRTKEYSFVLSTMPRPHARSRLLELDLWGVQLHIAIESRCMGNLNFPYNVMKNNKIHRLPQVSRVVVTLCVYGGFRGGLDANCGTAGKLKIPYDCILELPGKIIGSDSPNIFYYYFPEPLFLRHRYQLWLQL